MKCTVCLAAMAAIIGAAACTRAIYLPSSHTDSIRSAVERTDTLVVIDSVATEPRGDTVYHTRLRTVYRTATVRDTLRVERIDTVSLPVGVPASDGSSPSLSLWRRIAFAASALAVLLLWLLRRRL
ncbi:hypothetical protein [uncultured Muribaculum sp.]|uniref:hypothetical protein n=1 Tax=uncultured Muribaculum sp. TaxID=1918613 RepID=UPI0025D7D6D7|nr:hypothetical protein [uncultured Muribaculum sp.]